MEPEEVTELSQSEYFLDLHPVCAICGERLQLVGDMFVCEDGHPNFEEEDEMIYGYEEVGDGIQ